MHSNTLNLKNKMLQYEDIPDRIKVLHNAYKGETCYIATVGPSLKDCENILLLSKHKKINILTILNIIVLLSSFDIEKSSIYYYFFSF